MPVDAFIGFSTSMYFFVGFYIYIPIFFLISILSCKQNLEHGGKIYAASGSSFSPIVSRVKMYFPGFIILFLFFTLFKNRLFFSQRNK